MVKNSTALLKSAQTGDVDAFAELFESFRPMVYAVARRVVGDSDADDVVMETYLKAWQAIPGFKRHARLKTWLYRITNNCSLDFIRARKRREAPLIHPSADSDMPQKESEDYTQTRPDEQVVQQELVAEVRVALGQIPEEHRIALQLRYSDGLNYSEIAAATGVSIGTVMSRLFYGKRKLKKAMGEDG